MKKQVVLVLLALVGTLSTYAQVLSVLKPVITTPVLAAATAANSPKGFQASMLVA